MLLIPISMVDSIVNDKEYDLEPLIQVKVIGDDYPFHYSQGRTIRNSQTTKQLQFVKHEEIVQKTKKIITSFVDIRGVNYFHILEYTPNKKTIACYSEVKNTSTQTIQLELLSSFTLGGITPFVKGLGKDRLKLHQIRSTWSNEGRLVTTPIEELQLEPSWKPSGSNCIRYGQVGSMPNREYFPFVAIEDTKANVCWAIQLEAIASWQIELYRKDDGLCISGGIADREKGHWVKTILCHEEYRSQKAILTVGKGTIDEITQRIPNDLKKEMTDLPIIFNEFCTTWGNPSESRIKKIVDVLTDKGIHYFVIDCGWYKRDINNQDSWNKEHGDWNYNGELFPSGMKKIVEYINKHDMHAGLWFEWEGCGRESTMFNKEDRLYQRDGHTLTSGDRRFLDLRRKQNQQYLEEKVIHYIKEVGFKYLKMDYNANMGIGIDGPDSLGANLEEAMLLTLKKMKDWKQQQPELVLENCVAGGHRISIPYVCNSDITSISDAHESSNIPIIAANMHRMLWPAYSLIWAVVHPTQPIRLLYYKMASTFLGRMCLSGDVEKLDSLQWDCLHQAITFYKIVTPIIKEGISIIESAIGSSYKEPVGYQIVKRKYKNQTLLVIHTFADSPTFLEIPIAGKIIQKYCDTNIRVTQDNHKIIIDLLEDFDGLTILVEE